MAETGIALPPSLIRLSRLVGEPLGGPPTPVTILGEALVTLALRRHQVGPLLYAAALSGRHPVMPDLLQKLTQSYRASAARRETSLARLAQIAAQFAAHGIDWMALKGATQAARLYADPAWRFSADIDLLVAPRDFRRALDVLHGAGFVASDPPMPPVRALWGPLLRAVRDVTLIARDDPTCAIDLHSRLFVAKGDFDAALRGSVAPGKAPAIGPELGFYLIAHGALSGWVRLKWLVDLVPLFARLSGADRLAVLEHARRARAENSVAASLLLLRALFPFVALDGLTTWLEDMTSKSAVQSRLRRYVRMLSLDDDQRGSPLSDALVNLESNWLLFEAPSARAHLLISAPASSAMRRFGRALNRTDRALTLPPDLHAVSPIQRRTP